MVLTERETLFLDRRRKLLRIWPFARPLLLASVGILAAWLLWKTPLLINPYAVLAQLQAGTMPDSTVALLACLVLTVAMLLFLFVALAYERKYMAMINKLRFPAL